MGKIRDFFFKTRHDGEGITLIIHPETIRIIAYVNFWIMVLLAIIITSATVPQESIVNSPLVQFFGFNNICINWDYEPALTIIAMFYVTVEVPLILYIALSSLRWVNTHHEGKISKAALIFVVMWSVVELFLGLWFRMVFVNKPFDDVANHTLPFLGLQIMLCMVALENAFYLRLYKQIHLFKNETVGAVVYVIYLFLLITVTMIKLTAATSQFWGTPWLPGGVWKVFDFLWMALAAVLPVGLALHTKLHTEPFQFVMRAAIPQRGLTFSDADINQMQIPTKPFY